MMNQKEMVTFEDFVMKNDASIHLGSLTPNQLISRCNRIVEIYLSKATPALHSDNARHFSRKFRADKLASQIEEFISGSRPNETFQTKITGNVLSIENDKLNVEIPLYFEIVPIDLYEKEKSPLIHADQISDISYYDKMIRNCEKTQCEIEEKMNEAYFSFSTTRNFDPFFQEFEFTISIGDKLKFGNFWKFKTHGLSSLRTTKLKDFEKFTQLGDGVLRYHIDEKNINNIMKLAKYAKTFRTITQLKKLYTDLMTTLLQANFDPTIQNSYFNEKEASNMPTIMTVKHREHAWIWKLDSRYHTVATDMYNVQCNYRLLSEREVYKEHVVVA
jgi:hypothetical protein